MLIIFNGIISYTNFDMIDINKLCKSILNKLLFNLIKLYIYLLNIKLHMKKRSLEPYSISLLIMIVLFLSYESLSMTSKTFYPVSSNMGILTDYYMSFTPSQQYWLPNLNIQLTIPIEYDLSQIQNDIQCYFSTTGLQQSYVLIDANHCYAQPNTNATYPTSGNLVIHLSKVTINPLYFVLRNIYNPMIDSSSFFGLCIRSDTHNLQCDKQFQMVVFSPTVSPHNYGLPINSDPLITYVGQGSTYYLKMKTDIITLTSSYNIDLENVKIRVNFPQEFYSSDPICSLFQFNPTSIAYSAIQTTTSVSPSRQYSIECKNIMNLKSKYVYVDPTSGFPSLYLKIQNIQNPLTSSAFSGLTIDIMRNSRNQILQKISFSDTLPITAQLLNVKIGQENLMLNSTNFYTFYVNHNFNYTQEATIQITIGNNNLWKINQVQLTHGFKESQAFTQKITNNIVQSTVQIQNFGMASNKDQQIIRINLTSSSSVGDHPVSVKTFIKGSLSGQWQGIVKLNSTWGSFNRLHFSAVQQPIKLPVGKTGPLQLTLFLNYQLPPSQSVISNGSMIIKISPPIPTPNPSLYGVVKCYFKQSLQSANCTYSNSIPAYTLITMLSPPFDEFQYSQIPITITTEGGIDQQHIGLTINSMVQRYKFDVEFYLYNSSSIPSEVLYTNWVADSIQMTTALNGYALTYQCGEKTALHLQLTTPQMTYTDQRIMIQFIPDSHHRNAWAPGLGYTTQKLYKQFPCVISGIVGVNIKCDLWTYVNQIGPYNKLFLNSDFYYPYIMVYGFVQPVPIGSIVSIYLPGIKLSNTVGADAKISLSILSQTPGQTQPYLQLYNQKIILFTTISKSVSIPTSTISSVMPSVQIQSSIPYTITLNPINPSIVSYLKYDFSLEGLPSFVSQIPTCVTTLCYNTGYPNNWLVEVPAVPLTATHTITTTVNLRAMDYVPTLIDNRNLQISMFDSTGHTVQIINVQQPYIPQVMTGGTFNLLDPGLKIYSGLHQWYQIQFITAAVKTSAYPFLRLKLSSDLIFSSPEQCQSTSILQFNSSGIHCNIVSGTTGHELLVWNIQQITALTTYQIKVKLKTYLSSFTSAIHPTVDVYVNHNYSIIDSLTQQIQLVPLVQFQKPLLSEPISFKIDNPQILNQQTRINYKGSLFINFESDILFTSGLRLKFFKHRYNTGFWSTPTGLDSDPLVCKLNNIRFYCNPTNLPQLTILIPSITVQAGSNRLQISTEYISPYNGLYFPTVAGNYPVQLSSIDLMTSIQSIEHTFYIFIHPQKLQDLQIGSITKDINTESVYIVNFTIESTVATPTANHDLANYSRVFIQFPTIVNGQRIFEDNLGGYQGIINERVGCAFSLGLPNVPAEATKLLQCRLIPPPIIGAPVTVQIINFATFGTTANSMGIYIFKVFNPVIAYDSVQITVKINKYLLTGQVFPIFQSKYIVFLDPRSQNVSPGIFPSCQSSISTFFDSNVDVGHKGTITINAQTIGSVDLPPFYMLVKLPDYLPVQNQQKALAFASCPLSNFQFCVTAPDVNYILVRALVNQSFFQTYINNYPLGISQVDSLFNSMIIQNGRYVGDIQYVISPQRWRDIQGQLTFNYIQAVGLNQKTVTSKQRFHIEIKFTTSNFIPQGGSIQICFPPSVTKIYPYCRSTTTKGSLLKSLSGASGLIGCSVQNGNQWTISGFAALVPSSIIIDGYIDLPTTAGVLGNGINGQIITYSDYDQTNIFVNGSRIDYISTLFLINILTSPAMNANQQVFMTQRDVVRAGDIADFRVLYKFTNDLTTTGYLQISMSKNDIKGNTGGFVASITQKKVCQFIDISNEDRIGCQVVSQLDLAQYVQFKIISFQVLSASKTYQLRLSSQKYSQPITPEGLNYPLIPSTYKLEFLTLSSSTSSASIQNMYLQINGPSFTSIKLSQYNYLQNQWNLLWFELQPTVTIGISHQVVVEFPTKSIDGKSLFAYNLGLSQYKTGDVVDVDVFQTTTAGVLRDNFFMQCHIFLGDFATGMPVKVVCGKFVTQILNTETLRFALQIKNPITPSGQLSLPLFIYSYDPYLFAKTNYNTINAAVYCYDAANYLALQGFAKTASMQLEYENDDFMIGNANTYQLQLGDAFVVKFGFPLRVNDLVAGGCKDSTKATTYGDLYYHQRLKMIVCKVTLIPIPMQLSPATANLLFTSFYTPWYLLSSLQQGLYAIVNYYSTTTSQVVLYTDLFPIYPVMVPRYVFSAPLVSSIKMTGVMAHRTQCQRDDYVFSVQIDVNGAPFNNLQYTSLIGIAFPPNTTSDYVVFNNDCKEHITSQIKVKLCQIDSVSRTIFIEIVPGIYTNDMIVAIQTIGLAVGNPCLYQPVDTSKFIANYYSWFNLTASDQRTTSHIYMTIKSSNMAAFPITFIVQPSNGANTYFPAMSWQQSKGQQYFQEFPQFKSNQYSPFKFDIKLVTPIAAQAIGSYNMIKLVYGDQFATPLPLNAKNGDLLYNKPLCYLRNTRVQNCVIDPTNYQIIMYFQFDLPTLVNINVYFSIEDPRDLQINGFSYIGVNSDVSSKAYIELQQFGAATSSVFKLKQFQAKQTNFNPASTILPQRAILNGVINFATQLTSTLNILDMTFTINSTIASIRGLKFQIPLVDQFGVTIFSNPTVAFFGLQDGDQYPCGNNDANVATTNKAKCYLVNGDNTNLGSPATIIMTDFIYSTTIRARLLIYNPATAGVWFTINVKAYQGTNSGTLSLAGHQYVGYWNFPNIFLTASPTAATISGPIPISALSQYLYPSRPFLTATDPYYSTGNPLWADYTTWNILGQGSAAGTTAVAAQYLMFQATLNDYNLGLSQPDLCFVKWIVGNANSDDMIIFRNRQTKQERVYFIKLWTAAPWTVQYLKCKSYSYKTMTVHYYTSKLLMVSESYTVQASVFYPTIYTAPTIVYCQVMQQRTFIQLDMSPTFSQVLNRGLSWQNEVSYMLTLTIAGMKFDNYDPICEPVSGFLNTKGQTVTCTVLSTTKLLISNFNMIIVNYLGFYKIGIDIVHNIVSTYPHVAITATVTMYAGLDAYTANQYLFSVVSSSYTRTIYYWKPVYSYIGSSLADPGYSVAVYLPTYFTIVNYNSVYYTPNFVFTSMAIELSTTQLSMSLSIRPTTGFTVDQVDTGFYSFRFHLQGVSFTCNLINGITSITASANGYLRNLINGASCGKNYFYYNSLTHSRNVGSYKSFSNQYGLSGMTTSTIFTFNIVINGVATQPSYLRDWIGVKIYMESINYDYYCCGYNYDVYQNVNAYGQGFYTRSSLFTSVDLSALSNLIGFSTELMISMNFASVPFGYTTTDKLLYIQFNTGRTDLFPYINTTGTTNINPQIECFCIVSTQASYSSATPYNPKCNFRFPQTTETHSGISVAINVNANQYVRCYFPGFRLDLPNLPSGLMVSVKLIANGLNFASYPNGRTFTGGLYTTSSALYPFFEGSIANTGTIVESPTFYDGSWTSQVAGDTSAAGGYSLTFQHNGVTMTNPIYYIDFQKGGPIPDLNMCTNNAIYNFCRIYTTYRNIMVVQLLAPSTSASFLSASASLPKQKQPDLGSDYDLIIYSKQSTQSQYTFKATKTRTSANFLPTKTVLSIVPDVLTSSNFQGMKSALVVSFFLQGYQFLSVHQNTAKIQILYSPSSLITSNRGCLVSSDFDADDHMFNFYCEINTVNNTILITSRYYNMPYTATGSLQVIIGAVNPSVEATFQLSLYKWWVDPFNYGLQIYTKKTYTPVYQTVSQSFLAQSQVFMYPFNTRLYSDLYAPLRFRFKLPSNLTIPLDYVNDLTTFMLIDGYAQLGVAPTSLFQCFIKEYVDDPLGYGQTPQTNGFRNYMQNTQYFILPTYCNNLAFNSTALRIQVPRNRILDNTKYYELVVMPINTARTGFLNVVNTPLSYIKFLTFPTALASASQMIFPIVVWTKSAFNLISMDIVTTRPQTPTAMRISFSTTFTSLDDFPNHYIEMQLNNLDLSSISTPYNLLGQTIPCTLSTSFSVSLTRGTLKPNCVVNYYDMIHQVIKIRVENLGNLNPATYTLTFDYFLLPALTAFLQQSNTFGACMRFQSPTIRHQRCFGQLFVIDGYTNIVPILPLINASFVDSTDITYGHTVNTNIKLSYPKASISAVDEKVMFLVTNGYAATTPGQLAFSGSSFLWYNPMINLYVHRQNTVALDTMFSITMSSVNNPYPYQMQQYTTTPTIQLTYYSNYHPHTNYLVKQTPYGTFMKETSSGVNIGTATAEDIDTSIVSGTPAIVKFVIEITQSQPNLKLHQNDRLQIRFINNVISVQKCWVVTPDGVAYSLNTLCTVKPSSPTMLQLLNFWQSSTNHNLTVYALMTMSSSPITIQSYLYCTNGQIQYVSSYNPSITSLSMSMVVNSIGWTENHYAVDYYQQVVRPITYSQNVRMLYLALFLPEDLLSTTVFTIYLNSLTISPSNGTTNTLLICQWLKVSKYGRAYTTGVFSRCDYVSPNIVIKAPIWGLKQFDSSGVRIPYLLKIREQYACKSKFIFPLTSQVEQIRLSSYTGGFYKDDTLVIHPYEHFSSLLIKHYTITNNQLDTYHIQFGASTLGAATEYVLTLEIDNKYMVDTLGIKNIYAGYGTDPKNRTIIDNSLGNMLYKSLPNKWLNGIPYSCYTSTGAAPQQTCISTSSETIRISLLLESFSSSYVWKIPLLKNPSSSLPYRMNLTLWSYPTTVAMGNKQLFYQIVNQYVTVQTSAPGLVAYDIKTSAALSNAIQKSTNSLAVQFATYQPNTQQIIELKLKSKAFGIIDIQTFLTSAWGDATFQFFYFENVNLLIARKIANDASLIVNIGNLQQSNDYSDEYGFDWLKIHGKTSYQTLYVSGPLIKNMPECEISTVTFSVASGKQVIQNSQFEALFQTITPCNIPANSTLKLSAPVSDVKFLIYNEQAYCETNFRSMGCWVDSSNNLYVRIDQSIALTKTLKITTFVRSNSRSTITSISGIIFGLPTLQSTLINTILANPIFPLTSVSHLSLGQNFPLIIKPLYEKTYRKLSGSFNSGQLPFTKLNLKTPFSKLTTSNELFYYQPNITASQFVITEGEISQSWIKTISKQLATVQSDQTIPVDGLNSYAIQVGQQYVFTIGSMYESTLNLNNYFIGPVGQPYQFQYKTDMQIANYQVYPNPIPQVVTVINPLSQVGQKTVLGIQFISSLQNILPTDKIQIQLDSFNLIQNMYTFTSDPIECIQFLQGVLSATSILGCQIIQYPNAAMNIPLLMIVYPTKTVVAGTTVKVWLSPIINSVNVIVAGVTVKVLRPCSGQQLCTMYQGRGYYRTTSIPTNTVSGATFSPSPTTVLKTSSQHTFSFSTINLISALINYPQNYQAVMPFTCASTAGNCLVFPIQRLVVVKAAGAAVTSLLLTTMVNGIYVLPTQNFDMRLVSSTNIDKYQVVHGSLTTLMTIPLLASAANTFTIVNTQNTGAIFLRNYWNTVQMQIKGLFTNKFIKAFYIIAPVQVLYWDATYCNATISASIENPYPTRLECGLINSRTIQIIVSQGVVYVPSISQTQILTVYAKFWIQDFPVGFDILYVSPAILSSPFNAFGSYSYLSTSSNYYITQASKTILISQHKTPLISQVAFNTQSYMDRLAKVNQQTMFDILIDPITTLPIKTIQLIVPTEFIYPNVTSFDRCKLVYTSNMPLSQCVQTRKNNNTIVTLTINNPALYDGGPRILRIADSNISHSSSSRLFRAPKLPGYLYNMTISLYGIDGKLLQKQSTKNCSRIQGQQLSIPLIIVSNALDASQQQILDITFTIDSNGIRQGYQGLLAKGDYYSQIRIAFQNTQGFNNTIGNFKDGAFVGCKTSLDRLDTEVPCQFDLGTSINDQPAIVITGYNEVAPNSTIKLSFANIMNLPATLRNTISVSVKYYKVGGDPILQSFNMYQPTQAIMQATSVLSAILPTVLTISYSGQTTVNQPSSLSIILTPSSTIQYFIIKFPFNGINDNFLRFNPICLNCQKLEIFYRADLIRIYPIGGTHAAGNSLTYLISGFPSTEYIVQALAYPVTYEGYQANKIVNKQTINIPLNMNGCNMNSDIISTTSPYSGDTNVFYSIQIQVNTTQLSRKNDTRQLNIALSMPSNASWFSDISSCSVQLPLTCNIQRLQSQILIKNILHFTKSTIQLKLTNLTNPSVQVSTLLTFSSILYEQSTSSLSLSNQICSGSFAFKVFPSPPVGCTLSLSSEHQTTSASNVFTFYVNCEKTLKNATVLYLRIPREITFDNNLTNTCWANDQSLLLNTQCLITYTNGTFYITTDQLNLRDSTIDLTLNIVLNSPIAAGSYNFSASLYHAGSFYSSTNTNTLTFYQSTAQKMFNNPISVQVHPPQAGSQAIYVIKIASQKIQDKLSINMGRLNILLSAQTKVSYIASSLSNWSSTSSYFTLNQESSINILSSSTFNMYDLSQTLLIDTTNVNTNEKWVYIMLVPVVNPSYSNKGDLMTLRTFNYTQSGNIINTQDFVNINLTIQDSPSTVYQMHYQVTDNDVAQTTKHLVGFMTNYQFYGNENGVTNIQMIIDPPFDAPLSPQMQICLYYPNKLTLIQCQATKISTQLISFIPKHPNLSFLPNTQFFLQFKNLTNPFSQTHCDLTSTIFDYLASQFKLRMFVSGVLRYQTGPLKTDGAPCVAFVVNKADILWDLQSTLYSGFSSLFNLTVAVPTQYLRIIITSNDTDLTFQPNIIYFNSYSIITQKIRAIVSSSAGNKTIEVTMTHQQSGDSDIFRHPLPFTVKIISGKLARITIQQISSVSVGYQLTVPITLSQPSINPMLLLLTPSCTNLSLFTFSSLQINIPAYTLLTNFTFSYNSNHIPSILNISFKLQSSNTVTHYLVNDKIYLYFKKSIKYQTLPTIMEMQIMWDYRDNTNQRGREVYYCCDNNTKTMIYDRLKPEIIDSAIINITATTARISIWTRNQATLFYQIRQKGNHLSLLNISSSQLRVLPTSSRTPTIRNTSKVINAYQVLNLTKLQYETQYYLFVSVFDAFGDGQNLTVIKFKTKTLPNAVQFSLNCKLIGWDDVRIVRAIADVLHLDIQRIKVTSSQKNLAKLYNLSTQNQPVYPHQIVITPSLHEGEIQPKDLFINGLLNNPDNIRKLLQKLPQWVGNFDPILNYKQKPYYEINRVRPGFQSAPYASRISYYNATINVKFWNKAHVYAVLLIENGVTPSDSISYTTTKPVGIKVSSLSSVQQQNSLSTKQIIKGLDQYNKNISRSLTFNKLTSENGSATIFFQGLKPGSRCTVYITGTNIQAFEPKMGSPDQEVYVIKFNLMWNPNLMGNDQKLLEQLKTVNPQMYKAIKQFYNNNDKKSKQA